MDDKSLTALSSLQGHCLFFHEQHFIVFLFIRVKVFTKEMHTLQCVQEHLTGKSIIIIDCEQLYETNKLTAEIQYCTQ